MTKAKIKNVKPILQQANVSGSGIDWKYFFGGSSGRTFDRYYKAEINGKRVEKHASNRGVKFAIGNIDEAKEKYVSIASLESAIRKTRKALLQMSRKGANTLLVEKRLKALEIGLAALEGKNAPENPVEARGILEGLLPSMMEIRGRMKSGSAQETLLNRRIQAIETAMELLERIRP